MTGILQSVSLSTTCQLWSAKCVSSVVAAWMVGIVHAVSQFVFVINLPFCGPNKVDSFYCDFPRIMKLACVDTYKLEFVIIANSGFISMATFFSLIISYIFILVTVWKRSSGDLSKAFVTLSAHITVVILFFMPCMFLYVWPFPTTSLDKYFFIVDFAITPVLNPAIYTLRNKDMRVAMRRLGKQISGYGGSHNKWRRSRERDASGSPKTLRAMWLTSQEVPLYFSLLW